RTQFESWRLPTAIDASFRIRSRIGMLSEAQRAYIRTVARTLQILVGAMATGVLSFLAIVIFVRPNNGQPRAPDAQPIITYTAIGMSVAIVAASLIVPGAVERR